MNKKYIATICVFGLFLIGCGKKDETPLSEEKVEENLKRIDFFEFGKYVPNNSRNVLATVESKRDIKLTANLNGAIEKIFVKIGDTVSAGQVLARYKLSNDATQISYDNSLVGLESARNSAANSVKSAEIALDSAKREYEQAQLTQAQSIKQSFDSLDSNISSSAATMQEFINWSDRLIGVSDVGAFGEFSNFSQIIGSNNSIEKLNTKNRIKSDKLNITTLSNNKLSYPNLSNNESALLEISQEQLNILRSLRDSANSIVQLVTRTPITANFSQTNKSTFEQQALKYQSDINRVVNALTVSRESALGIREQVTGSLLSAQNRIKNAEAQLELTKSNANSQVSQASSQVRIAGKSKQDLRVTAPFAGEVTEIFVSEFQNVNPGNPIIGLISQNENKTKITAQLSKDEYELFLQNADDVKAVFPNGKTIVLLKDEYSDTINPVTQKTKIVLTPKEKGAIDVPVGSVITLKIPLQSAENSLLVPITAISFEPSGAEVLKILSDGTTERQGVITGDIKGNAIEILQGLELGEKVVIFRNRTISGEKVLLPKDTLNEKSFTIETDVNTEKSGLEFEEVLPTNNEE